MNLLVSLDAAAARNLVQWKLFADTKLKALMSCPAAVLLLSPSSFRFLQLSYYERIKVVLRNLDDSLRPCLAFGNNTVCRYEQPVSSRQASSDKERST